MWHFESEHGLSYFHTWECFADGEGYVFCEDLETCYFIVFHIEDVVNFAAWDAECVAFCLWVDVEKCVKLFVLSALVAWYLSLCYL